MFTWINSALIIFSQENYDERFELENLYLYIKNKSNDCGVAGQRVGSEVVYSAAEY